MPEEFKVSGVVKQIKPNLGILRDPAKSFQHDPNSPLVIPDFFRKYKMVEGATVTGMAVKTSKGVKMTRIDSICGKTPEEFKERVLFKSLTALGPTDRFRIADSGDTSMRIMDLIAPIGKGTRGLIVSPPKAGKTMLLEKIANSIRASQPDTRIIVLLIDERPEEVTLFKRQVDAEVFASCSDQSIRDHVELVELTLAHARTELECGQDIVILVDSLTRMGRAFNNNESSRGRTLSGGMGAGAMETPRRFFGLARNVENGGSITIIATALIDTGSRMDDLIFQEFKGTGNSELILDRKMAESRIWPAVDINASGTRREEQLYDPKQFDNLMILRRALSDYPPAKALDILKELIDRFPTNEELLADVKGKL